MDLEGRLLGNRYEIIKKIGNGGMATVYKAKCHVLNRYVAVKVLREEFTTDEEFIRRFNTEAQAAASLTHPNIVSIFDVGVDNGIYYIPKQGGLLGKSYLDPFLVIMRKYVRSKTETYGYVTGISFVNQLGLTTQMPAIIEIVTNREATNGRTVTVGNQKVRIKKAAVEVSDNNAELLQLLDGIGQAEKYTELTMKDTIDIMRSYVKKKHFTKEQLSEVTSVITGATAKKLIEWGMIYEFAS